MEKPMGMTRRYCVGMLVGSMLLVGCDGNDPFDPLGEASFRANEAPSGIAPTVASHTRIELSWLDRSTRETGFELHRSTAGPNGSFELHVQLGAGVVGFSDQELAASTQHCYRVRAYR